MKTPPFWYQPPGLFAQLLAPLGWLYATGATLRRVLKPEKRFSVPIISVGNLVSGGAGKTPVALALAQLLQNKGYAVHFVTRGYKGSLKGPLKVNPDLHRAQEVGDEPLLLAPCAPTWVAKERTLGIQKAIEHGATLVILDDGHQTAGIKKNLSFIVVDFLQGMGNGHVLPAGPLREPLSEGLKRTHALIGIGEGDFPTEKPLFKAKSIPKPFGEAAKKVFAFCGLGYPQKFYTSLLGAQIETVGTHSFPDHHAYTEKDMLSLEKTAHALGGSLVTTRKDWVKLPPAWQKKIPCFEIDIVFESRAKLYSFIEKTLKK